MDQMKIFCAVQMLHVQAHNFIVAMAVVFQFIGFVYFFVTFRWSFAVFYLFVVYITCNTAFRFVTVIMIAMIIAVRKCVIIHSLAVIL